MVSRSKRRSSHPKGYPSISKIERGCAIYTLAKPEIVQRTCSAKLHNPSQRDRAALLHVFKNNTLAAIWMLRDIEQRQPLQRFAKYRKRRSTKFNTQRIAAALYTIYGAKIHGRYAINSHVFVGLCLTIAAMLSSYFQQMVEARKKGHLQRYYECAEYMVDVGRHTGKRLGSLGRKTIYGFAFIAPTYAMCEEALYHINLLLNQHGEEETLREAAEKYKMAFGPHRGRALGSMRMETLRRLRALVLRDEQRADQMEKLRKVAQDYLRFTPPGFPSIRGDGLSTNRRRELERLRIDALEAFGQLPSDEDEPIGYLSLTEEEHRLFRQLEQRAFAAARTPYFIPLRWTQTDACVRERGVGLTYDPAKDRYVLVAYVLDKKSRFCKPLLVKGKLYDLNNPEVQLQSSTRPVIAMLFELECGTHQQTLLNQAYLSANHWKAGEITTGGCVRSATLHAHYDVKRQNWWFEAQIAVAAKVHDIQTPKHVVGVHADPRAGIFVAVLKLDGTLCETYHFNETTISKVIDKHPIDDQQPTMERTSVEQHHRIANALSAICRTYQGQLGIEEISYRRELSRTGQGGKLENNDNTRSIVRLLSYKLLLLGLPKPMDIYGVAPRRDCGRCGIRQEKPTLDREMFTCSACDHTEPRHINAAREVARRTLWKVADKARSTSKSTSS